MLNVAHLFCWTITVFENNYWAQWYVCPILTWVSKFFYSLNQTIVFAATDEEPFPLPHYHGIGNFQMLFLCPNKWCFVRDYCSVYHRSCTHHIAHLRQECRNSKYVTFQEKLLKVLKCSHFIWLERQHDCSSAVSFANCVMTLYLFKSASANISFYTNNSKMTNFESWHSCCKWAYMSHILLQLFGWELLDLWLYCLDDCSKAWALPIPW